MGQKYNKQMFPIHTLGIEYGTLVGVNSLLEP
jgi:hypothetical protein